MPAVAVNVTAVPAQIEPEGDAAILTVGVTLELTDIVIVFEFAVLVARHPPPVTVIVQVTALLLASELDVYVFELLFCTLVLPTLKLYVTVPPPRLPAVAVNVTDVPAQMDADGEAAMLTVGVMLEVTDIVIVFEFTVLVVRHPPPVIVIVQVTVLPFASELDV